MQFDRRTRNILGTGLDRDEGLKILASAGWLSGTPSDFRHAVLSSARWLHYDAGAPIQSGGEEAGELIGLASGVLALKTILGPADTPIMHFAYPVFWLGYVPIITGEARRIVADAKRSAWVARISQRHVEGVLAERPQWWRYLLQPAIVYGDASQAVAADLLIRDSERRCAAILLRLSGRRFAGARDNAPIEFAITQVELAGAANLSRNSVGAILKRLAARGLIELGYRGITVLKPAALRELVEFERADLATPRVRRTGVLRTPDGASL